MAPITAIHNDPKIQQVRAHASSKPDDIPFLLFPVRVETRFMQIIRRKDSGKGSGFLTDALRDIVKLQLGFDADTSRLPATKSIEFLTGTAKGLNSVDSNLLSELGDISAEERSWVRDELQVLEKKASAFIREQSRRQFPAPQKTAFQKAATAFQRVLKKSKDRIAGLKVTPDETYREVKSLVSDLRKIDTLAETLAGKNLPFRKRGKKDKLIAFVRGAMHQISEFYDRSEAYYSTFDAVNKTQLDRIRSLHKRIVTNLNKAVPAIKGVHSDRFWATTVERLNVDFVTPMRERFAFFEQIILGRLTERARIVPLPASRVYYDSLKTLKYLNEFNLSGKSKFSDVNPGTKKVLKSLQRVAEDGQKAIRADSGDAVAIEKLWTEIDAAATRFKTNLSRINNAKPSHKFSQKKSLDKLDEFLRVKLNPFRNIRAGEVNFVSTEDFQTGNKAARDTLDRVEKVNALLTRMEAPSGRVTSVQKQQLLNDLKNVSLELKNTAKRKLLLDPDQKKSLEQRLLTMTRKLQGLGTIDTGSGSASVDVMGREIETLVASGKAIISLGNVAPQDFNRDAVFVGPASLENELWVRIYPDDVAIHTHEEKLTDQEVETASDYWKEIWIASGDRELEVGAWRALCELHGSERAAYIAKKLDPTSVSNQNAQKFNTKPDVHMITAQGHLSAVLDDLKNITASDSASTILGKLRGNTVANNMNKAFAQIKSEDTVHQFLYEKFVNEVRQVQSRLSYVFEAIKRGHGAPASELEVMFSPVFSRFTSLQEKVVDLVPMPPDEFFRTTEITYKYPSVQKKEEDWTIAPHSRVMPDHFVVLARRGGVFQHIKVGNKIGNTLQVGLDPAKFELDDIYSYTADGDLTIDPDIKWLADYNTAVDAGMGITLTLTPDDYEKGFDQLIVIGIKNATATAGRSTLEGLLENHHFTPGGMAILPVGTPTNNTEKEKSAYNPSETDFDATFDVEMGADLFKTNTGNTAAQDGKILSEALGVDYSLFQHISGADSTQTSAPIQFHKAVYPATMGFYLHELFNNIFSDKDVDDTHEFFSSYVTARGSIPTVRIDAQPYGILPTTAFSRFKYHVNNKYKNNLVSMLGTMNQEWTKMRQEHVAHAYNAGDDPQAHFMEMLGLQPTSMEYFIRYGANTFMSYSSDQFPEFSLSHPAKIEALFKDLVPEEISISHVLFKSRASSITYFKEHSRYTGVLTQQGRVKLDTPLENNYIEFLLQQDLFGLLLGNNLQDLPGKALLGVLLRQSLLWSYARAAMHILKIEDLISTFDRFKVGGAGFFEVPIPDASRDTRLTKWSFLFRSLNRLNGGVEVLENKGFDKGASKAFYDHIVKSSGDAQNPAWTMAAYLNPQNSALFTSYPGHNQHNVAINKVKQVRTAMNSISGLPSAELENLTREHLDLCSYRLDAWLLGLANERLAIQRISNRHGILLGCWGYLEDLRKGGARTPVDPAIVPEKLKNGDATIYTDEDNKGHIHMPSITHAITAAILRAGYESNDDDEDIENQMAVNLSSARVRMALQLIEGVKNGQEVAAVLGYQLERGLHERYNDAEMDEFIHPLRKEFPLQIPVEGTVNDDSNYNGNVIHGTDLLDMIDGHIAGMTFDPNFSLYEVLTENNFHRCPLILKDIVNNNPAKLKILLQEIDRIADAFDALGDLALSESVYQISRGNHVRAGAVLQALAKGRNIPDPQIVTTPRTGTVVTQRVIHCLETVSSLKISENSGLAAGTITNNRTAAKPAGWSAALTPRALAEPSVNKFIGSLLGPGSDIRCIVEYVQDETAHSEVVTLNELGIQAIDLVLLLGSGDEGGSELNKRIAYRVRDKVTPKLPVDVELQILTAKRDESWGDDIRTLYEIMPMVQQLQTLLSDIRPAHADDLRLPPQEAEEVQGTQHEDVDELDRRTLDAEQMYAGLASQIDALFAAIDMENLDTAAVTPGQIATMRTLLFGVSAMGEPYAVPDAVAETSAEIGQDLVRQLVVIRSSMTKKLDKAQKLRELFTNETNADNRCTHLVGILKTIFGNAFFPVPHFTLQNKAELKDIADLSPASGLLRHDTLAMEGWLKGIGRVREKMYAMEMASMLHEVNGGTYGEGVPVQLPYRAETAEVTGDYWLGAEYPDTYEPDEDKLSLVLYNREALFTGTGSRAAVVWDEWLELIPNKTETTGLTFNYDQPDATPPQNILLAVTPEVTGKWDWDNLVYTIIDTVELAKNRAVEPDHVEKGIFAGLLPTICSELIPPNVPQEEHLLEPNTQIAMDFLSINQQNPTP